MRTENTNIKLTIPIPFDKPDLSGVIHTKEAVENAIYNLRNNIPILYKENEETDAKVIGSTTGTHCILTHDSESQIYNLTIDGVIFYGGAEIVVNEIEDGKITDFSIVSIGITT